MALRFLLVPALAGLAICATTLSAATKQQISQAVERGVKHLLSVQGADGTWHYGAHIEGATALAGLALLESGVKPSDPAIQRAAECIRKRGNSAASIVDTYSISLAIFFLDRLRDPQDQRLLTALGERLRNGQLDNGAWTYHCNGTGPRVPVQAEIVFNGGDNSNTQFAILGLWVARRHGVDVQDALERVDRYFRASQLTDGGWNYIATMPNAGRSTGPMTCAGLLGLLVQMGQQASLRQVGANDLKTPPQGKKAAMPPDPMKDPAVQKGFECLANHLTAGNAADLGIATPLYYLWSVERVGMAYGVKKIGPVDWYETGADRLLSMQQADGSWPDYNSSVGTSLALLFLRKTNVASDLTRLVGGDAELRSGRNLDELQEAARTTGPVVEKPTRDDLSPAKIGQTEPARLAAALEDADDKLQLTILEELRDRKGGEATLALAQSIGRLEEPMADRARQFLVQRLQRMTPATLARYLEYDDDEIRQAAARAAGSKDDLSLAGPLVELLNSRNTAVADAAHDGLVRLTGQNFGRFAGESTVNRFVVARRWKTWWESQPKSREEM